ncbi:CarD family transcriptional regulator [Paenibacillus glacialis]|uniref:CarD-like/TRCF RNAP-interacting domain-containing protein n=1 Tax=Paenibacillus glacialis TaxID=494026 RepID=A0A168KUV1_9BACL|nr:CarD family transcriptional regulator [Paenibacillus glacialis]OAB42494.1 hypothetical protein PGLA_12580 [Paenibacillus glacialis]
MNGIKAGEMVFYPLHGVGLLEEKVTRLYEDKEKDYFKVYFEELKMDIFIPEDSAEQQGIRPLTSQDMLEQSQIHFFEKFCELPLLAFERKKLLDLKLKTGDIFCVTEVIRDLVCAPQYELKLGFQDKLLLEAACKLLKNELMYVLDLSDEKASDILKEMMKKRLKYK